MSDILLQGHLYVTENYIAFHSNVFGYVTRVNIIIIIVTRPRPAFGRLGLGVSSRGYSSHG